MATAINDLEKLQFGLETTPGTLVAADTILVVDEGGEFRDIRERQVLEAPQGVLAEVEQLLVRKASEISYSQPLTFEEVALPLLCGFHNATPVFTTVYTYTFDPTLAAPQALAAATWEVSYTDGTTRHVEEEFGFGTCRGIGIEIARGGDARLSADWFGRAAQASTFTPSLAKLTGRTLIPSDTFAVDIDSTWAGLGTTNKAGLVTEAALDVDFGVGPDYTLDGRADLDLTQLMRRRITGTIALTCRMNANAATERTAWKNGDLRFIQLLATGAGSRSLAIDCAVRYIEPPTFGVEDGQRTMSIVGRLMYDPTAAKVFRVVLVNNIAAY